MAEASIVISKECVFYLLQSAAANDFQMEVQCFYCKFQAI